MTVDPEARIARTLARGRAAEIKAELRLYVAIGDSFTAGTGSSPGEGWPERLATRLRRRHRRLALCNLARDGATSAGVLDQLPEALQLEPDLVTVVCGPNDVLRSTRPDPDGYSRRLATIFARLRGANSEVRIATATAPVRWDFLALGPRTRARVERGIRRLNEATRMVAAGHGVACLDVAAHPGLDDPENFAADGLHPSALGHARAAAGFAHLLRRHFEIEIEPSTPTKETR
jgi:lysophospholipase L1-like esterase